MPSYAERRPSRVAHFFFTLLNPAAYGAFVSGMIFDVIYFSTQEIFWVKAASWLNFFGLLFAIIPRLINLYQVWISRSLPQLFAERRSFWLNLVAIVLAIFNAFIHSRDAWGVMPAGLILSLLTVLFLVIAVINQAVSSTHQQEVR
ncbi:hypothetical protein HGT70_06230 [Rosenbergiella collisarenosi]|uniref:DUF2231 domain-containing protein n=1 Tax=Rosenbergiella collisarenosi TaxID=1544695 RepID=UPI001BDA8A2B|nr:DUF2231 domain-containing protein [Rosenbergiella collisarenosi]MBT0720878.1 hypothetical protein [Rosenbergiella collisarenosi]